MCIVASVLWLNFRLGFAGLVLWQLDQTYQVGATLVIFFKSEMLHIAGPNVIKNGKFLFHRWFFSFVLGKAKKSNPQELSPAGLGKWVRLSNRADLSLPICVGVFKTVLWDQLRGDF
ncbi:MAG TPA: hypothetical protein PLS70_13040, partial [Acidobacteriota bacterium]|nr:hypothetical protein [Acidobacteriota bacterium]